VDRRGIDLRAEHLDCGTLEVTERRRAEDAGRPAEHHEIDVAARWIADENCTVVGKPVGDVDLVDERRLEHTTTRFGLVTESWRRIGAEEARVYARSGAPRRSGPYSGKACAYDPLRRKAIARIWAAVFAP
jgi:hypothetical protein